MVSQEFVNKLLSGVGFWNKWREENPDAEIDLEGANLTRADLRGANLGDAKLEGAKLQGANLKTPPFLKGECASPEPWQACPDFLTSFPNSPFEKGGRCWP